VPAAGYGTSSNPAPAVLAVNAPPPTWTAKQHLDHLRGLGRLRHRRQVRRRDQLPEPHLPDTAALPWLDTDNLADRSRNFSTAGPTPPRRSGPTTLHHRDVRLDIQRGTQYTDENGDSTAMAWISTAS